MSKSTVRAKSPEATPWEDQKKKRRSRKYVDDSEPADDSPTTPTEYTLATSISPLEELSLASPSTSMPLFGSSSKQIPVFVASLGNPKPYLNTLHSAGHIALNAVAVQQKYKPWAPYAGGQLAELARRELSLLGGYKNTGHEPTLWKCGSMMNVSGPAVKKAWLKWKKDNGFSDASDPQPRLVVVHDELERELGDVSVRTDHKASARGHNGLRSIMASMPNERFIRIGVGIGRPTSRDPSAVSEYVLRGITSKEAVAIQQAARKVEQQIAEVHEGGIA